jgi:hypothetical protein
LRQGHFPIPRVLETLEKIAKFGVFLDLDLTNGFHQFRLDAETSRKLSVQTPWGQFEPLFLPEGVPVGSGVLQEAMYNIFKQFDEWCIIIFDNLLVLAHDYQDAEEKLQKVIKKAAEANLVLKMKKSWLGVKQVKFFGYECTKGFVQARRRSQASYCGYAHA